MTKSSGFGRRRAQLGAAALAVICATQACAGPLRDAIMGNRAEGDTGMQRFNEMEDEPSDSGAVALPEGARALYDIAYGPDARQRVDVYLPRPAAEAAPILFMVHGGAWKIGDKRANAVVANKVAHWLPKGYILVSANYRLSPAADPLEQAGDVAKALAMIQSKAREWQGDPDRVVLMGHSAGAHLVSLLTAAPEIAKTQGAKPWLGTVALDSAAYDLVQIMQARHFRFYDQAFGRDPGYWRSASPTHRLSAAPKPMLAVCSSMREDACPQARGFADKASTLGGRVTVLPVKLRHREINEELGLPGPYTESVDSFLRSLGLP